MLMVGACNVSACSADTLHTLSGKAIEGRVVEKGTNKPIPGAIVVVTWSSDIVPTGFTAHNAPTICYHAETATTDDAGRYHIAAWKSRRTFRVRANAIILPTAYKPGYASRPDVTTTITMAPFVGTLEERLKTYDPFPSCDFGGPSQRNLFPMLKAVYEETRQLAQTKQEQAWVEYMKRAAARSAVTYEPSDDASAVEQKIQDFLKDNLR